MIPLLVRCVNRKMILNMVSIRQSKARAATEVEPVDAILSKLSLCRHRLRGRNAGEPDGSSMEFVLVEFVSTNRFLLCRLYIIDVCVRAMFHQARWI